MKYEVTENFAHGLDAEDPLSKYRENFHIPPSQSGGESIYLCGNSLGLQPKSTKKYIEQELEDWAKWGVEGHFHARKPWLPYHENLTEQTARLVGAKPIEVVVMNTLSVNLHLMMVSFYRPTQTRFKILIEKGPFPSDLYAIQSQVKFHGFYPKTAIISLMPRSGENVIRHEDILAKIKEEGSSIALILIGNVNYLTGQAFNMHAITQAGHEMGCKVGFDLAHGAGNLEFKLNEWGPDFAVWCSYKYLNSGPGSLSGCFVHERHSQSPDLPRFAGWWGHRKDIRFRMGPDFEPIQGAEGWQLSNPPIFQLAALRASMEIFDQAGMKNLRAKSEKLTGYLSFLLDQLPEGYCEQITPRDPAQRGAQISLRIRNREAKTILEDWAKAGVICDLREPDTIRVAPTPLYNRFIDVYKFVKILEHHAKNGK